MDHTVFYSWQSDLPNKLNRSFIESALEKAAKTFSKDETFSLNAVVDRDTFGIPGSPSIVEAITSKIAKSDVFVCDISIINSFSNSRPMPNPNVLYELGYASSILGWERIIMIQNTAFGNIDKLPFDLRGRRVVQYYLDETSEKKSVEKEKLKNELFDFFKNALKHYSSVYNPKEKPIWWGTWMTESKAKVRGGDLHISRVSSDAFFFEVQIYDGARSGDVFGKAQIITPHSAYAKIKSFDNKNCELTFQRRLENGAWLIDLTEGSECNHFHGMGAYFSGEYKHQTEYPVILGYLDELDLNEIERITGKYISVFLENFQQVWLEEINDNHQDFKVLSAGVKGLYTIMQSIAVFDDGGNVWCACLDPKIDKIRYFDNLQKRSAVLPKPINEWLERFSEKKIIKNNRGI
jgi:hypothetical protein